MELNDLEIQQLEAYWLDELPEAERQRLELRMASEPDFRSAADNWRQVFGVFPGVAVVASRHPALRARLDALPNPVAHTPWHRLPWIWALFGATLLAALYLLWPKEKTLPPDKTPAPSTLYARAAFDDYIYPPEELTAGVSNLETVYLESLQQYERRDFEAAKPGLEAYVKTTNMPKARFYLALTELGLQRPDAALVLLEGLPLNAGLPDDAIRWYRALAYLERGELERGRELLTALIREETVFAGRAGALLKKI